MPRCYLLTLSSGSSLDQQSNNVSLFNIVEQLNLPRNVEPPPGALLPLEIHAYFHLDTTELNQRFEMRFALVASSGLETLTDAHAHKSPTLRYRTRTMGLPVPPIADSYQLRVDLRAVGSEQWARDPLAWPLVVAQAEARPAITH
ncbi:MAG TPA: hypothetical protein VHV51_01750 [Polyangiaceae bacterium]|nr:hypothetical protein [Polyangiaceae bacterium]